MSKITNLNGLAEFDIAQYIKTDADVAQYLCQVLEEGDSGELGAALGHIANYRARLEAAGKSRQSGASAVA
jgi:probable addiction module antidote protein